MGVWRAPDAGLAIGISSLAAADDRTAALAIIEVLDACRRRTHPCQLAVGPAAIALFDNTFQLFLPRCECRRLIVFSLSARTSGSVAYYAARLGATLAAAREVRGLIGETALCP